MKAIKDSLLYAFHVITHPFDGFWCAQRERRGDVRAATILIALVTLVSVLSNHLTGFIFNENSGKSSNLLAEILGLVVPVVLWCVANWSITTLLDGEGSFRDIYIATGLRADPHHPGADPHDSSQPDHCPGGGANLPGAGAADAGMGGVPAVFRADDHHQYTVGKTLLTVLIAIVGMAAILFLFLLFFALIQQLMNFLYIFYKEMTLRV